jgi:hypothetical protein
MGAEMGETGSITPLAMALIGRSRFILTSEEKRDWIKPL